MALSAHLAARCNQHCELCQSTIDLQDYDLPASEGRPDASVALCQQCFNQVTTPAMIEAEHFRCLGDSMWSPVPAVQVLSWRLLDALRDQSWANDLLDMLYLDDDMLEWAKASVIRIGDSVLTRDSNGTVLMAGDNVTIIKDLDVKGTSFVAKRGTVVRGISLTDNPEHIEGRVNGTRIVILTCYVKKS